MKILVLRLEVCVQSQQVNFQHLGYHPVSRKEKGKELDQDLKKFMAERNLWVAKKSKAKSMAVLCQIIQNNSRIKDLIASQ